MTLQGRKSKFILRGQHFIWMEATNIDLLSYSHCPWGPKGQKSKLKADSGVEFLGEEAVSLHVLERNQGISGVSIPSGVRCEATTANAESTDTLAW